MVEINAQQAADSLSGGLYLLDELGLADTLLDDLETNTGTAPNSLAHIYGSQAALRSIGPEMWYTEGQRWHKIYGYRFSVAFLPESTANPDIDAKLSSIQIRTAAEAVEAALTRPPASVSPLGAAAAGAVVGGLGSLASQAAASVGLTDELDALTSIGENFISPETPVRWKHFTLPIPPSQMVTKPIVASKATPTLGGVVEETSQVKMWLISMGGTTGTSPSRFVSDRVSRKKMASRFRDVIETTGIFNNAGAQFQQFVAERGAAFSSDINPPKGAINEDSVPSAFYNTSSIDDKSNGFTEAQELQKFFFMYNALKSRFPKNFALVFSNLKTDQSWRCIVRGFQLQQNADNPMLYKYSINLECWNVRSAKRLFNGVGLRDLDRFGPGGDLAGVDTLSSMNGLPTINALSSILGTLGII